MSGAPRPGGRARPPRARPGGAFPQSLLTRPQVPLAPPAQPGGASPRALARLARAQVAGPGAARRSRLSLPLAALALLAACKPSASPNFPPPAVALTDAQRWPGPADDVNAAVDRLLITNSYDDTVSLMRLDGADAGFPEVRRAPVGENPVELESPHHAALSADGQSYFVAFTLLGPGNAIGPHGAHGGGVRGGKVLKLSARTHQVLASARVDANPGDLALSPDGALLAVTHFDLKRINDFAFGQAPSPDARLLLLSASTLEEVAAVTVCPAPHGVAFSREGTRVFVACYSDEVAVVDLAAGRAVTRVKVAANAGGPMNATYQPYGLAVSSATGDVFISALAAGEVRVLRGDSLTIDEGRTARVGGNPLMMGFNADASRLYVPHQGDDAISEVEPATGRQLRLLQVPRAACTAVHQAWVAPGDKLLLVVCEGNQVQPGALVTLELQSGQTVGVTPVGVYPDFVGLLRAPAPGAR